MIMNIRDAKLTDSAAQLVLEKRNELIRKGYSINTSKGSVVNKLLEEYAQILKERQK